MTKTFLIACPIRNGVDRINYVWDSYLNQDYPLKNIGIYYIVNNTTDDTIKLLEEKKQEHGHLFKEISWLEKNYDKLPPDPGNSYDRHTHIHPMLVDTANLRLDYGLEKDYDFIAFPGSDCRFPKNGVSKVIKHNVDVITLLQDLSTPFYEAYNIWEKTGPTTRKSYYPGWKGLKKLEIQYYITCLIMKKEVVASGIRFQYNPDEIDSWEFTISDQIRAAGFDMYLDTTLKGQHKPKDVQYFNNHGKKKTELSFC